MTKVERINAARLEIIEGRIAYLHQKAAERQAAGKPPSGFIMKEAAALEWAVRIVRRYIDTRTAETGVCDGPEVHTETVIEVEPSFTSSSPSPQA